MSRALGGAISATEARVDGSSDQQTSKISKDGAAGNQSWVLASHAVEGVREESIRWSGREE